MHRCVGKKDHKIKEVKIEVNNVIYFSTKNKAFFLTAILGDCLLTINVFLCAYTQIFF